MQVAFIIITLVVLWILFGRFYKKQSGAFPSILFTAEIVLIVWINIPLLITLPENAYFSSEFVKIPFDLYKIFGLWYTIIANILLTMIGVVVSSVMSKVEPHCSKKTINKHFNDFIENASSLKLIGKDLDFLMRKDCVRQKQKLIKLKHNVEILCANPYSKGLNINNKTVELIKLYHELSSNGNEIRFYDNDSGDINLLGQIKVDDQKKEVGLFVYKIENDDKLFIISNGSRFTYQKQLNGFLLECVKGKFKEVFDKALNPIIKFIALDLGGVYLDGDIDAFFEFLNQKYQIKIKKKPTDRLDLDYKLSTGDISILAYIERSCSESSKKAFKTLSTDDKAYILRMWNSTWKKDDKAYSLVEKIISFGFQVIPFSNLDKDNGEMYLRENYFPEECRFHVFSYEKNATKSDGALFKAFVETVNNIVNYSSSNIDEEKNSNKKVEAYQILLIDDQRDNINKAEKMGWDTIYFSRNNRQNIDDLIKLLKNKAILPQKFEL